MSTPLVQRPKAPWVLVVLLGAMVAALSAGILGAVLDGGIVTAVAWAGATFVAIAGLGFVALAFLWSS